MMVELQGKYWVVHTCPKLGLVLTKEEFIAALRRFKAWKRRQRLEARLAEAGRKFNDNDGTP
jgi:hypothetical protein